MDQYQEAMQHPERNLHDPVLKSAKVDTDVFGLPKVASGGFALTYKLSSGIRSWAVRCFHKRKTGLHDRYARIHEHLRPLRSNYFLDFEFQDQGLSINGAIVPIVKMQWGTDPTLDEFTRLHCNDAIAMRNVCYGIKSLSDFLTDSGISHGDLQHGNILVGDHGKRLVLIDYDGMVVPSLRGIGTTELGLQDYQHPGRLAIHGDENIDRFSLIVLYVTFRVLEKVPEHYARFCDGMNLVFKRRDYLDPGESPALKTLADINELKTLLNNFCHVCGLSYEDTPSLTDFICGRLKPKRDVTPTISNDDLPSFPRVSAVNLPECSKCVGDQVELIGRINSCHMIDGTAGRYAFINFSPYKPWEPQRVVITIWPKTYSAMSEKPSSAWTGRWLSVVGLMTTYKNKKNSTISYQISASNTNLHFISEDEAATRLQHKSRAIEVRVPIDTGSTPNSSALKRILAGRSGRLDDDVPF